ncbi:MAG: RlmE family RNA methyltransferase [Deltaproteobacteria bacterium]|nr:RlmE family RNA methyltransferase [Deltaproteobacteria bacterium]
MSTLRDRRHRHDRFFERARRADFAARSVYKLEEIQERHRLLGPRARVLDLGCRPGSWLEYCARLVGPGGALVGLDRTPLDRVIPGARIVVGDVLEVTPEVLRGDLAAFDVVLSDMAPDTSGIRSLDQARSAALFGRALDLALALLASGGHFVGKLFQGPDWQRLLGRVRAEFDRMVVEKPAASRKASIEQYVVGIGRRP